jgi:transcription initiation factor TFIIIB Brf1 subunit/transcription initiation factor TFIIB
MTCSDEHWIDNDPCPNCGSTRTGVSDEHPGLTECDDCGQVFDVQDPSYGQPDDEV